MQSRARAFVLAAIVAASIALPQIGSAAVTPVPRSARPIRQIQVRPVPVPAALQWRPVRTGVHVMYGMITGIQGSVITLERRNGRVMKVNAAAAIAHGDYSAPLFIGKLVSVDGSLQSGTFTASHVFRLENLNQLPNDR